MPSGSSQRNSKIFEQIKVIRVEGKTNMLDYRTVQRLAFEHGFYELVDFIETDLTTYGIFIFFGVTKSADKDADGDDE